MNRFLTNLGIAFMGVTTAFSVSAQDVNYTKYPDYVPYDSAHGYLPAELFYKPNTKTRSASQRPDHVDNSKTPYFPAVFNQDGGSCGSASAVGYQFTHEINSYRHADASLPENVYPTHFTWLLAYQNSDKIDMLRDNGVPNSVVYEGRTYSRLFGNQTCSDNDYGWMQGYDKWYSAMFNRIEAEGVSFKSLEKEENREMLKQWLWNHFGDESYGSGGIAGFGVASAATRAQIPSTAKNNANGVTGLEYIKTWGKQVDHALTIVGYDDRIEFDLDENGIAGEVEKDEVGAWIIVNSWGNRWANKGFVYCPYKHARATTSPEGVWGNWITAGAQRVRKNYRPLRTFKFKMDYSRRSELKLSVGVASDPTATEPEEIVAMHHFIFAGAGNDKTDPEMPMLGRWKDGIHYEPMEFGYDLTDISSKFDMRETLKYFFIIDTKSTAKGTGKVYGCEVIDYEFDEAGVNYIAELPEGGLEIQNAGKRTLIAVPVIGDKVYQPNGLYLQDGSLHWSAPLPSGHNVTSYNVYAGEKLLANIPAKQLSYAVDGSATYSVSAMYDYHGTALESRRSNTISAPVEVPTATNKYLKLTNNTVTIDNLLDKHLDEFTIDFMYKPNSKTVKMSNGNFELALYSDGKISTGWSKEAQALSISTPLSGTTWKHVAVTVKGGRITAYVNGKEYAATTSAKKKGIDASAQFILGTSDGRMNCGIDELRFWSTACTPELIELLSQGQMAQYGLFPGLMAYYRMESTPDNKYVLADVLGNYPAVIEKTGILDAMWSERDLFPKEAVTADFTLPEGPFQTGIPIVPINLSSISSTSFVWNAPEAGVNNRFTLAPPLTYNEPGTYKISLAVTDKQGTEHVVEKEITVERITPPAADFVLSTYEAACGDEVILINKSAVEDGCTYEWTVPGSETETVKTYNAKVTYRSAGRHSVKLTVRKGNAESVCEKFIEVSKKAPKANMSVTPNVLMKGEKTNLLDRTYYDPVKWTWIVENGNRYYTVDGQHSTLTLNHPGKYNVTLKVSNDLGADEITRKEEVVVCNADAKNGLNLDGSDDEVAVDNLFAGEQLTAFTIDWWMHPGDIANGTLRMGDQPSTFMMTTSQNGQMTVAVNSVTAKSPTSYVIAKEWHHYAVAYNAGTLTFYRDGKPVSTSSTLPAVCPAWNGGFHLGGADKPMNAIIDELRIWKSALTDEQVLAFCNAPIADVDAARTGNTALTLYFPFDQSSGDVEDASGNGYTGKRINFGPDGDAWSTTTGEIFWLDTEDTTVDVTSMYLKNYKTPFLYDADSYINGTERFRTLTQETEESPWQTANSLYDADTNIRTEFFVDANAGNCLALTNGNGFAKTFNDLKLWQTVSLPAGAYELYVTPYAENKFFATGSYIVADRTDELPDTKDLSGAFASTEARNRSLTFVLEEPATVSLGLVMNISGLNRNFTVNDFCLKSKPFEALEADGAVEIDEIAADKAHNVYAKGGNGTLTLTTATVVKVTVATIDGKIIYNGTINGTKTLNLPSGLYIVNNQKVVVR